MSIVGRRSSSDSGWNWSRPPSGPRRSPPPPPLLPLAAGGLIILLVAVALLAVWLSDSDNNAPAGAAGTATPSPSPPPTAQGPTVRLNVWDGAAWQSRLPPKFDAFREGEAVPFLLRIDRAQPGTAYPVTIRYDCRGFDFLTAYDRDAGSGPALAAGAPGSPIADSAAPIPDDPATPTDDVQSGSLSLWGGSLTRVGPPLPSTACSGDKSLAVTVSAAADTVYLMWAAQLSHRAAESTIPLRVEVEALGLAKSAVNIDPDSVMPVGP